MPLRNIQPRLPGLDDEPAESSATVASTAANRPVSAESAAVVASTAASGPPSLAGKSVWVVDANSLIFQVFHAIPEMTSPQGETVNAVFGFTRDMLFLLEKKRPDYLLCAFDPPGPTFRNELFAGYKENRKECPSELIPQFPKIRQVLAAMGIPAVCVQGFEADDVLATIARQTDELGGNCYLVTGDKDCRQLITDRVKVYNVRKDQVYDEHALAEDWGVRPDQVVDFQSLVGDSVDNVPGVRLVGPKLARDWLVKFGALEQLFARANELGTGQRIKNLLEARERVIENRKLVRLDAHVPLSVPWEDAQVRDQDPAPMLGLCGQFGFHRFAAQIRSSQQGPLSSQQGSTAEAPPAAPRSAITSHIVDTPEKLAELIGQIKRQPAISFDLETTSIAPTQAEIVGYAISWADGEGYYIPVRAPAGEQHLDPAATLQSLRGVIESAEIGKIGQNLKYDALVLRACGVTLAGIRFDTLVASYLLDAGERNHNLDELAQRYLNHTTIKISELIGTGKNQKRMDEVPVARVAAYAVEDAEVAWRLWPILERRLAEHQLIDLFEKLELPLVDVLVELEHNGVRIDVERLAALSQAYGGKLVELEKQIYDLAGHPFNIASPKQLQQVLFVEQSLPVQARTKTGPSTDASVLEELARMHPLPAKIIEYRQYAKLKSTYVDALPCMVNTRTGRVHCSFHQAVTATGRLSSSDPNLQNIPIRTQSGREIRSAFLPAQSGWRLLAADYSQIELRVLAHFCQDATLCEAFARDEDIHALVASQVYGVELAAVTSDMRRAAKAVNFGIIYGQSPFGLAKALGIEQEQAAAFINAYFNRYPGVEQFLTQILEECRTKGYVSTVLGRRRAIQGIRPLLGRQRNLPERTAINTVIQGSAADLIKQAMIAIHRRLAREQSPAKMLLQIHDELVFESPEEQIGPLAELVVEEMTGVMPLRVPLKVDIKTGQTWADTEEWELGEAADNFQPSISDE